jgi:hypothetical protein
MKKNKLVPWQCCHNEKRGKSRIPRDLKMEEFINQLSNQNQKMEKLPLTPPEPMDSQMNESNSQTVSSSNEQLGTNKLAEKMYLSSCKFNDSEMSKIITNAVIPANEQIYTSRPNRVKVTERIDLLERCNNQNFDGLDNAILDKFSYYKGVTYLLANLTNNEICLFECAGKEQTSIELTPGRITPSFVVKNTAIIKMQSSLKVKERKLVLFIIKGEKGHKMALRSIHPEELQVLSKSGSRFNVDGIEYNVFNEKFNITYHEIYLNEI